MGVEALQNTQGKTVLLLKSGAVQDDNLIYEADLKRRKIVLNPLSLSERKKKK